MFIVVVVVIVLSSAIAIRFCPTSCAASLYWYICKLLISVRGALAREVLFCVAEKAGSDYTSLNFRQSTLIHDSLVSFQVAKRPRKTPPLKEIMQYLLDISKRDVIAYTNNTLHRTEPSQLSH